MKAMKKFMVPLLAVASLTGGLATAGVQKAPPNTNQMVKLCTLDTGEVADALCRGFVLGVIQTTSLYVTTTSMAAPFCVPQGADPAKLLSVYREYLGKNHELKHFPAASLAVSAFTEAFPCSPGGAN